MRLKLERAAVVDRAFSSGERRKIDCAYCNDHYAHERSRTSGGWRGKEGNHHGLALSHPIVSSKMELMMIPSRQVVGSIVCLVSG